MILYHGSDVIVEKPLYGYGKRNNDYGQGFYCSADIELAREWACKSLKGGFLNVYRFDTDGMNTLRLDERNVLEWIAVLLSNRTIRYSSPIEKRASEHIIKHYSIDLSPFDVVIGYRADDSYFSFARAFLSNTITVEQLSRALKLGNLGIQYFLNTPKAFEKLTFVESEPVFGEIYYPRKDAREEGAREQYYKLLEEDDSKGLYMSDLLKES